MIYLGFTHLAAALGGAAVAALIIVGVHIYGKRDHGTHARGPDDYADDTRRDHTSGARTYGRDPLRDTDNYGNRRW